MSHILLLLFSRSATSDSLQPHDGSTPTSLSPTVSWSLLKLMSIELVMPSNHFILCHPLLLPLIFPSIRVFSNELALRIRWPKYWSFSFSISPSNKAYNLCFQCIHKAVQLSPQFNYRIFSSSKRKHVPISNHSQFPSAHSSWQLFIYFCTLNLHILKHMCVCVYTHIRSICDIFDLASFTWHNIFKVYPCWAFVSASFLLMDIFLCGYTTFWLLIHQLVNIWVVSTLWLLKITLLWTFVYRILCEHTFFSSLGHLP